MSSIRIANPDETLKKWQDIRKKLYDISREIANADIKLEVGGAGQDDSKAIYLEITNKDEFLKGVESANDLLLRAEREISLYRTNLKARLKEE